MSDGNAAVFEYDGLLRSGGAFGVGVDGGVIFADGIRFIGGGTTNLIRGYCHITGIFAGVERGNFIPADFFLRHGIAAVLNHGTDQQCKRIGKTAREFRSTVFSAGIVSAGIVSAGIVCAGFFGSEFCFAGGSAALGRIRNDRRNESGLAVLSGVSGVCRIG